MPCFRLPYVGARVPSTSMYAIGPSNSRPRPYWATSTRLTKDTSATRVPRQMGKPRRAHDEQRPQEQLWQCTGPHDGRAR